MGKITFGKRTVSTAVFSSHVSGAGKGVRNLNLVGVSKSDKAKLDNRKGKTIFVNSKVVSIPILENGKRVGSIVGARNVVANKGLKTKNKFPTSTDRKWRAVITTTDSKGKNRLSNTIGVKGQRTTLPAIKTRVRKVLR